MCLGQTCTLNLTSSVYPDAVTKLAMTAIVLYCLFCFWQGAKSFGMHFAGLLPPWWLCCRKAVTQSTVGKHYTSCSQLCVICDEQYWLSRICKSKLLKPMRLQCQFKLPNFLSHSHLELSLCIYMAALGLTVGYMCIMTRHWNRLCASVWVTGVSKMILDRQTPQKNVDI